VLVPSGVTAFGEGLGVPLGDVRLYLALREVAHHRLFGHAGWLRARIINAVEGYARGIHIDTERIQSAMSAVDPQNPESVQQALTEGLFEPEDTPAQKVALARLETLLALVEGWVDEVAHTAAAAHLPSAGALRETVRRRRASGGPAEATFAALVGLELRPRRLREAAALWRAIADLRGLTGRDAVWDHPDLLPGTDDLDDPDGYARRSTDAGAESLDLSALEQEQPEQHPGDEPGNEATGDKHDTTDEDPRGDDGADR
jgi:putative hydrolase